MRTEVTKAIDMAKRSFSHKEEQWDDRLEDAFRFTMPTHMDPEDYGDDNSSIHEEVYDSTAIQAADSLANSLVAGLTPPWSPFYLLKPGPLAPEEDRDKMTQELSKLTKTLFLYLNLSNFTQEIQPSYLDAIISTGAFTIEENKEKKGFTFRNIPLSELSFMEIDGEFNHVFRKYQITGQQILDKYGPDSRKNMFTQMPDGPDILKDLQEDPQKKHKVMGILVPSKKKGKFLSLLVMESVDSHFLLSETTIDQNPYIIFRWSKISGSSMGVGPALRAIHDIIFLNKMKEFALDNAALMIGGVWTGEDDGVFNPYTARIEPTTVIPVSSNDSGRPSLQRLDVGSDFNVTQFMLNDLRSDIKKMFHADRFGQLDGPKMTATEVIQRSRVIAQELGATFGRFQTELLIPLVQKMIGILAKQGLVSKQLKIDGSNIDVSFVSSLAQAQELEQMDNIIQWITVSQQLGQFDPEAALLPKYSQIIRDVADILQIDPALLHTDAEVKQQMEAAMKAQQAQAEAQQQQNPAGDPNAQTQAPGGNAPIPGT